MTYRPETLAVHVGQATDPATMRALAKTPAASR